MFQDGIASDRIKMCADCRVVAQFEAGNDPLRGKPRPVTRTTEDYLREREIEEARAKVLADREKEPKGRTHCESGLRSDATPSHDASGSIRKKRSSCP